MTTYLLVLLCFILSFVLHAILHRTMKKHSVIAYFFGFLLLVSLIRTGYIHLPWTSTVFYLLLTCFTILFYIADSLGTELPSSIILASFKKRREQSETMLVSHFSDRGLIFDRVDDLKQSGLVRQTDTTMKLTQSGKLVWKFMKLYRVIFNRKLPE